MKYIIIAVCILLYLLRPKYTRIKGNSMYPTLQNGKVYRMKLFRRCKRGDIAMVYVKGIHPYVKRIIAIGGDKLTITQSGSVAVNGEWLDEPYILPQKRNSKSFNLTVPEGCYWVMGDNRDYSTDSRHFGAVAKWQIEGKIILKKRGKKQ